MKTAKIDGRISQKIWEKYCDIKIAKVNSILITKSVTLELLTLVLGVLGVSCDVDIFKLTASAQSIYREVYDGEYPIKRNK